MNAESLIGKTIARGDGMKREGTEHPKLLLLMDRLDLPRYAAVGLLELLWHWTARYAAVGNIGRYTNAMIARGIHWDGDPDELIGALVDCGWLDQSEAHRLVVHDWADHADEAVKKKLARAGREFLDETVRQPASQRHDRRRDAVPTATKPMRDAVGPEPESCRDGVETASRQCRDSVETVSRPPGPEPEPEPVPGPGARGRARGPMPARPGHGHGANGKSAEASPPRDPSQPPDSDLIDAATWPVACAIADEIERVPWSTSPVVDPGGTKRAKAAALLIAAVREGSLGAPLRRLGMPGGEEAAWIASVVHALVTHFRFAGSGRAPDPKLATILGDLRRWPDGLYPSPSSPGIEQRKACRIEEAARIMRRDGVPLGAHAAASGGAK